MVVCPTGALAEKSHVQEVLDALADPKKYVVVQHAPAVSVTLGEAFGVPAGNDVNGAMVAALRRLGFKRVFDTSFSADLTIMEEGSELVHRLQNGGKLPMLTSCSPGWIKFVETAYPDFIGNLSTCKSPQQMMGAIIKNYFAEREGIDPKDIFSVSIMPCTAKKFEAGRPGNDHRRRGRHRRRADHARIGADHPHARLGPERKWSPTRPTRLSASGPAPASSSARPAA